MMANWTKAKIADLLRSNDRAVERAMIVLYDRQTTDEKQVSDTRHTNQRGFSCFHAKTGSYYGRWCKSGKRLTGQYLEKARKIALRYTQQLADEANAKTIAKPSLRLQDEWSSHNPNVKETVEKLAAAKFEKDVQMYMRATNEPRDNAERVIRNIMAGKCPDGCCGGDA